MMKCKSLFIIVILLLMETTLFSDDSLKEIQGTWKVVKETTLNLGMLNNNDVQKITSSKLIINNSNYFFQEELKVLILLDSSETTLGSGSIKSPGLKYRHPFIAAQKDLMTFEDALAIGLKFVDIDTYSKREDLEITVFQLENSYVKLYLVRNKIFISIGDHLFVYEKLNEE